MERYGFIHEKLDIKILILFILRRLPGIVAPIDLQDFTQQCDEGFGYFEYSDCLAELIESGLVIEEENGLRVSKRGADAAETVESSLPFSVRPRRSSGTSSPTSLSTTPPRRRSKTIRSWVSTPRRQLSSTSPAVSRSS